MAYTAYRSHMEEISNLNPFQPIPPIGSVTSENNERPQENSTRDEDGDEEDDQTNWSENCQAVLTKFVGDDGAVVTLEEILPDLKKTVRRLYKLSTKSDLPVEVSKAECDFYECPTICNEILILESRKLKQH
jgi:hypothetical protein